MKVIGKDVSVVFVVGSWIQLQNGVNDKGETHAHRKRERAFHSFWDLSPGGTGVRRHLLAVDAAMTKRLPLCLGPHICAAMGM